MRRALVVALLGCVASTLAPASAGPSRSGVRVVHAPYEPNPQVLVVISPHGPGVAIASVRVRPEPGERAFSLVLDDDAGHPVRGHVIQGRETIAMFCGKTPDPIPIDSEEELVVEVFSGGCGDSVAPATTGMITATFTKNRTR